MSINIKYKMTFEHADRLIERYYEGLTSVEEERKLRIFLSRKDLPEKYKTEQAIFSYFTPAPNKNKFDFTRYLRRTGIAAALLIGVFFAHFFLTNRAASYAYFDGKKITDIQEIKLQAMVSLANLPSEQTLILENLQLILEENRFEEKGNILSTPQ